MVAYTLASETQFRNWLATTSYSSSWTGDAATIRRLLEQSTRIILAYCGNQGGFGPTTANYEWDLGNGALLDDPRTLNWDGSRNSTSTLPWMVSLSSVTVYNGTDRSSSTALVEDTDYLLFPYTGFPQGLDPSPYYGLKYKNAGSNSNPFSDGSGQKVLSITGQWGWADQTVSDTTLSGSVADTTTKTVAVTSAANLSAGQTILINSERMYIESISSNDLTVERGVAGSTATTHSSSDQLYAYIFPASVTQACLDLTRIAWVDRSGGLQDEITVGGNTITWNDNEKKAVLHDIDSIATHSGTAGVTF